MGCKDWFYDRDSSEWSVSIQNKWISSVSKHVKKGESVGKLLADNEESKNYYKSLSEEDYEDKILDSDFTEEDFLSSDNSIENIGDNYKENDIKTC